jgi:predicted anti-sigma-YlaC factor YlaD
MSHQPYETFLFSDEVLDQEEQDLLDAHLKACEVCTALSKSFSNLQLAFSSSSFPEPAPGFTERWQFRLASAQQRRQIRNLWMMTMGFFALASLTMLIIILINLYHVNWVFVLSQWIARVSLFAAQIRQIINLAGSLANSQPVVIPIIMLAGTACYFAVFALTITWFRTIIKLYSPNYEKGN